MGAAVSAPLSAAPLSAALSFSGRKSPQGRPEVVASYPDGSHKVLPLKLARDLWILFSTAAQETSEEAVRVLRDECDIAASDHLLGQSSEAHAVAHEIWQAIQAAHRAGRSH
jgi:hypothetical protein